MTPVRVSYPVARAAFCTRVGRTRLVGLSLPSRIKETPAALHATRWKSTNASSFANAVPEISLHRYAPNTEQPPSSTPPKSSLLHRTTTLVALSLLAFTLGFTMSASPALSTAQAVLSPPTDAETLTATHFTPPTPEVADIERQIFAHPLARKLLQDPAFTASRPHLKIPEALRAQNLTGGTLLGPDRIAVPPLQFGTADGSRFVSLQWLGPALCGHPGIVHGGLQATLLDEGLARCCFPALPNKVAVTASLKIEYKRPCMAGQIIVLTAETTRVEGRKAWVTGRLMTLPKEGEDEGIVLSEGEALFIEPRQAASMKLVVN